MYVSNYTKICDIDFEELKEFYTNHSKKETLKHFNINGDHLRQLCKNNNWEKDRKIICKLGQQTYFNKTGYYSNFNNPESMVNKHSDIAKLKRRESQKKTLLEKYNVETIGELQVTKDSHHTESFGINVSIGLKNITDEEWEQIIKKRKITYQNKYGVDSATLLPQCRSIGHATRYKYKDECFDSKYELFLYVYALDHNEDIEHESCKIPYVYNNEIHYYFPDFIYNNEIVEIKGEQFFNEGKMVNPYDHSKDDLYEAKYKCMINNNVKIYFPSDCKKFEDYFNENYNLEDFKWPKKN